MEQLQQDCHKYQPNPQFVNTLGRKVTGGEGGS